MTNLRPPRIALFSRRSGFLCLTAYLLGLVGCTTHAQVGNTLTNIGAPVPAGDVANITPNSFTLSTTGSSLGGSVDNFTFYYALQIGDFDVSVQVSSFPLVTTSSPQLAGLMVRPSLTPNSRHVSALVEAPNAGNSWRTLVRATDGSGSSAWPHSFAPGQIAYTNVWLRLRRVGNTFTAFSGVNGTNWTKYAEISPEPAYPETVPLGFAVCGVNGTQGAAATFANYSQAIVGPSNTDEQWNTFDFLAGGVKTLIADGSGGAYVGGDFTSIGGISANRVAHWDGTNWFPLGQGISDGSVMALARGSDGVVYAGGQFQKAGGVVVSNVAKWNGTNWVALGSGIIGDTVYVAVRALAVGDDNTVYAGGAFGSAGGTAARNIARWNGSTWSGLRQGLIRPTAPSGLGLVLSLATNGKHLYAGGSFDVAGATAVHNVARWDGTSWSDLAGGLTSTKYSVSVYSIACRGSDVYFGGVFSQAGSIAADGVASWNGANWSGFPGGSERFAYGIALLGDDLIAGGASVSISGGLTNSLSAWTGSGWSPLGRGLAGEPPAVSLLAESRGRLLVVGQFSKAGGIPAANSAIWTPTNLAPLVRITSPTPNGFVPLASVSGTTTVSISATASDPDDSVAQVEFYSGNQLLATKFEPPYEFDWPNVPAGLYDLYAVAVDSRGEASASPMVSIKVDAPNIAPAVQVTGPQNSARFNEGDSITFTATANDADGAIAKVEFFVDGTNLIGSSIQLPFAAIWQNARPGNFSLTARATDNRGLETTSAPISFSVNARPVVSITSPIDGSVSINTNDLFIRVSAQDPDGAIQQVALYRDGNFVGKAVSTPYIFQLVNLPPGTNVYTAVATDNEGVSTTSAPVQIFEQEPAAPYFLPRISLLWPTNDLVLTAPANLNLAASATVYKDNLAYVLFQAAYQPLGPTPLNVGESHSLLATVSLTNLAPGNYTFTALVRDIYESSDVSAPVKVTVLPPTGLAPLYRVTDLGTLGGLASVAAGLNNLGAVVGRSLIANNSEIQHAFAWRNGVMRDLPATTIQAYGVSVNDSETVLGTLSASGGNPSGAFLWSPLGGTVPLPTLGGSQTQPWALNNAGQAVGSAWNSAGVEHPVVWENGVITKLPAQISGQARAINSLGQIAGFVATTQFGTPHAMVWDRGATNDLGVLTELGGRQSFAWGINDSGVVVGGADDSSTFMRAVVWKEGKVTALPALPGDAMRSAAFAINNSGLIVGQCQPLQQINQAMLWIDGIPFDLNNCVTNPIGTLTTAVAINDRGQIAGTMNVSGNEHAYLLTPITLAATNPPPTISLVSPTTNDVLAVGKPVALSAIADSVAGSVARVDFYVGNVVVATATNAPFSATWQPTVTGSVSIKAVAVDSLGGSALSQVISLNVLAAPPKYQIVDIGPLAFTGTSAAGINSYGSFVGGARIQQGDFGYIYDGGIVTYLNKSMPAATLALDINDSGQVVVILNNQHAGLYQNGAMTDLGALPNSSGLSIPRAINNSGQIAGQSSAANGQTHATIWTNNTIVDIGLTLGESSQANDINNNGVAVGWHQSQPGVPARAFIYHPTNGITTFGSTIGGQDAQAWSINDAGGIVGNAADASGYQIAFLYQDGLMKRLGTLGGFNSFARAINNSNQIVGYAEDSGSNPRAFVSSGTVVSDLNKMLPSGATAILRQATAINDKGQILAVGYPSPADQNLRVFLLNPYPAAGQPNQPPSVALETPAAGAVYYEGDDIPILASALDQDGSVRVVNFLAGETLVASATTQPYSGIWRNVAAGTYSLAAVATDNSGASQQSAPVSVVVRAFDPSAPAVAILSSATASENADVWQKLRRTEHFSRVDLIPVSTTLPSLTQLQDYQSLLLFSTRQNSIASPATLGDLLADYMEYGGGVALALLPGDLNKNLLHGRFRAYGYFPWTTGQFSSHGNVTMVNVLPDHPILAGVNSLNGGFSAEYLDQFTLTPASVTVSKWATSVPFAVAREVHGSRLVGLNFKPVSKDAVADGWEATTDGALLMANSLVWAGSPSPGRLALSLSGDNPGSYLPGESIALRASSTNLPTEGIVRFYTNNVLLATATNLPAQFNWTNPPIGSFLISATYSNTAGLSVVTRGVSATVNSRISIDLTAPADNTVVYLPTNILMQVTVSDMDASIAKVDYYLDGTQKIGTSTTPPYTFNFTQLPTGTLNISATATDTLGAIKSSATHRVTVINSALPQTTTWTGGIGSWFVATNWTAGPPRTQDTAVVEKTGNAVIELNAASATKLTIGLASTGTVTHLSGSLNVSGEVILGENSGSSGTYRMDGSGTFTAANLTVALQGKAAFVQNSGSVTAGQIALSGNVNGSGSYELNGGTIQANGEIIGHLSNASFRQNGGTNRTTSLEVGRGNSTIGTYELNEGALTVDFESIGSPRTPIEPLSAFYQNGGTHTVTSQLRLGDQGAGALYVAGGRIQAAQFLIGSGGILDIVADPATNHFAVTGTATLTSLLRVTLPAGYVPLGGDTFVLMTYGARQGTFANVMLPSPANGVVWDLHYQTNAVILRALPPPEIVIITAFTADAEPNLFRKTVTLSNNGTDPMRGARMYFPGLPAGWELFNAAGEEDGVPYIETDALIPAGASIQFEVQFLNTRSTEAPKANYTLQLNSVPTAGAPTEPLRVEHTAIRADGSVALDFTSARNARYWISYSDDLQTWRTAPQQIIATGGRTQWLDSGAPKTVTPPSQQPARYYRILSDGSEIKPK